MSVEIHNLTGEPLKVEWAGMVYELQHEEKLALDGFSPDARMLQLYPSRNQDQTRDWRPKLRDEPDREDDDV